MLQACMHMSILTVGAILCEKKFLKRLKNKLIKLKEKKGKIEFKILKILRFEGWTNRLTINKIHF